MNTYKTFARILQFSDLLCPSRCPNPKMCIHTSYTANSCIRFIPYIYILWEMNSIEKKLWIYVQLIFQLRGARCRQDVSLIYGLFKHAKMVSCEVLYNFIFFSLPLLYVYLTSRRYLRFERIRFNIFRLLFWWCILHSFWNMYYAYVLV